MENEIENLSFSIQEIINNSQNLLVNNSQTTNNQNLELSSTLNANNPEDVIDLNFGQQTNVKINGTITNLSNLPDSSIKVRFRLAQDLNNNNEIDKNEIITTQNISVTSSEQQVFQQNVPAGNYLIELAAVELTDSFDVGYSIEINSTSSLDSSNFVSFNDDFNTDLVWRNDTKGKNSIWLMDGTKRTESVAIEPVLDPNWDLQTTGDLNNDGNNDLVWRNDITGKNSVWLMDGTKRTQSIELESVKNLEWDIKGTGDFNHDGKIDILWRNDITGKNSVWLMDGTKRTQSIKLKEVPNLDWHIQGTGDFNVDGKTDIVWRNDKIAATSVWFMDGTDFVARESISLPPNSDWTLTV